MLTRAKKLSFRKFVKSWTPEFRKIYFKLNKCVFVFEHVKNDVYQNLDEDTLPVKMPTFFSRTVSLKVVIV